jgi:hypothetical protein
MTHHRDTGRRRRKEFSFTTEDTETTEFLLSFLRRALRALRALRVLRGDNILLCDLSASVVDLHLSYRTAITSSLRSVMSSIE